MRYLSYALYPLVAGYAVYALLYRTHKSWYSWVLNSLVGAVYAFGCERGCGRAGEAGRPGRLGAGSRAGRRALGAVPGAPPHPRPPACLPACLPAPAVILMCPQLYLNYKLRSVAHLPWCVRERGSAG